MERPQTNFIIRTTTEGEGETTKCTNLRCWNGLQQIRSSNPSRRLLMCTQGLKGGIIKSTSGPGSKNLFAKGLFVFLGSLFVWPFVVMFLVEHLIWHSEHTLRNLSGSVDFVPFI